MTENQKNQRVLVVINGVPYDFPAAWITGEDMTHQSSVELSNTGDAPLIMAQQAQATVSIQIPMAGPRQRTKYKIAKEIIRGTQYIFSNKTRALDENTGEFTGQGPMKIPFTDLKVPWQMMISCAYIGVGVQLACCTLDSFACSVSPKDYGFDETWTMQFSQFKIDRTGDGTEVTNAGKSIQDPPKHFKELDVPTG